MSFVFSLLFSKAADAKNEKNKLTLESWTKLTHQIQAVAALTDTIEVRALLLSSNGEEKIVSEILSCLQQSLGFVDRLKGQEDFLSGEIVALQSELNDLQKRLADTQVSHYDDITIDDVIIHRGGYTV